MTVKIPGEVPDLEVGRILLAIARSAIADALARPGPSWPEGDWLRQPGACFVTLRRRGELRGCIGSIEPFRPLAEDVRANARAAAFRDPRFPPVEPDELDEVVIEISLLLPLEPLTFTDEQDLLSQLRPGVDGLLLEEGQRRGTFLPSVWRELAEPEVFLRKLKVKAGLAENHWSPQIRVYRYRTRSWAESGPLA